MTINNNNVNQNNAASENNISSQLMKSPATKYFNNASGVNGTATLSRPSYRAGKDTWVSEYSYKDKDVNVVIRQKMKVTSYNNKVRDYYVEQQIVDVEPFKNVSSEEKESVSEYVDSNLSEAADKDALETLRNLRQQMLAQPRQTMNAQAHHSAQNVLALME